MTPLPNSVHDRLLNGGVHTRCDSCRICLSSQQKCRRAHWPRCLGHLSPPNGAYRSPDSIEAGKSLHTQHPYPSPKPNIYTHTQHQYAQLTRLICTANSTSVYGCWVWVLSEVAMYWCTLHFCTCKSPYSCLIGLFGRTFVEDGGDKITCIHIHGLLRGNVDFRLLFDLD